MQPQPTPDSDNPHSFSASPRLPRLTRAVATSIRGFLASICASQDPVEIDLRPRQFKRDMAPMMSN